MSEAFRDRVAATFRQKPGIWIDGRLLRQIGGEYAWRTRVSECRTELGMVIENRVSRLPDNKVRVSEYRYQPEAGR